MKVIVCLLIAVHLVVADVCDHTDVGSVDFSQRLGNWYNYARVNNRPEDVHAKCLYYHDGKLEDGKFKYSRYFVDDRTEEEHEMEVVMELDKETNAAHIVAGERKVAVKLLCLADDFEIGQSGEASDKFIYIYTKVMHPSKEVVEKIHQYLKTIDVDLSKLILVDQANCPRCTCEDKHSHDHAHHHHMHDGHGDHAHHHHH